MLLMIMPSKIDLQLLYLEPFEIGDMAMRKDSIGKFGLAFVWILVGLMFTSCTSATASSSATLAKNVVATPNIGGCSMFPSNNVWNIPVTNLPVDPNSDAYINSIGSTTGLHPDFGSGTYDGGPIGIPYTTVSAGQPKVNVSFDYADESDLGPYPIPSNAPIEGGPNSNGDRHVLIVDQSSCKLYELYAAYPNSDGSWHAGSGAIFDLTANNLRPSGWTSADAAGLPILPGLVRHDEVAAGAINHALRFTVAQVRNTFIWPARHKVNNNTSSSVPPMGQRFRLKANFDISSYPHDDQVILTAMKTYGIIIADIGSNWYISGAPDDGWDNDILSQLHNVKGSDFEAVDESSLQTSPDSAAVNVSAVTSPNTAAQGYTYYLPFLSSRANAGLGTSQDSYNTFLSLQNTGSQSAQYNISYYDQSGNLLAIDHNDNTSPLLPSSRYTSPVTLPSTSAASAILTANQPMAAIVAEGGSLNSNPVASAYTAVNGVKDSGTTISAPLALNQAYGFSTALVIQNGGTADTQANITYYNADGSTATTQTISIPQNQAVTINQQRVSGLSAGFSGWASIKSSTSQPLAGVVIETNPSINFFSTVSCVGTSGKKLYIPVVFQNAFGNFNTGMTLANPSSTLANVTITYYKNDGTQTATSAATSNLTIAPFATASFFHGDSNAFASLGKGFVGSAVVSSDQPLISAVNQGGSVGSQSLTGTFGTILGGNNSIALPTIMNQAYGSFSSGVQILNTSSVATNYTVKFYNSDGSAAYSTSLTGLNGTAIPAGGVVNLYQGGDTHLPTGFNGTMVVTPDVAGASAVVVANVSNGNFFYTYAEPDY